MVLTIEEVKCRSEKLGKWVVLSDLYRNKYLKLDCECVNCGFKHNLSWQDIQQGVGCPQCIEKVKKVVRKKKVKQKKLKSKKKVIQKEKIKQQKKYPRKKVGRPKNPPTHKEMLQEIIPVKDIFDEEEERIYNSLTDIYLKDFDKEDLTSSDMDDIMSLAMNKVLEIRLLKSSKGDTDKQIDVSAAIEKLKKQTEKIKENLSSRRKDRINPNEFKGFSIVDLAVAFDLDKRRKLADKIDLLRQEEKEIVEKRKEYTGNRCDLDIDQKELEE